MKKITQSFPNLIRFQLKATIKQSFHFSFDDLTELNKLQSFRLTVIEDIPSERVKSCDSWLLSLLISCPHLMLLEIDGFKLIQFSTLKAIIEIAKTRPTIDMKIDLRPNLSLRSSDDCLHLKSKDDFPKNLNLFLL